MLKKVLIVTVVPIMVLFSCAVNSDSSPDSSSSVQKNGENKDETPVFPVADYLNGQMKLIENLPVTLLRIKSHGLRSDSAWVNRETIRQLASPFFQPVLDSVFLQTNFTGSSFLDQTINAVTFTYSAKLDLIREGFPVETVSIYVDPDSHQVERIYVEKEAADTSIQLTWRTGEWLSIRKIIDGGVLEEKIIWNFNK